MVGYGRRRGRSALIGVSVECFFALGKLNVMLGDAEQTTCYSIIEFFSSLAGNLRCPLS